MNGDQVFALLAVCGLPCLFGLAMFWVGVMVGRRGLPRLTWDRSKPSVGIGGSLLKGHTATKELE